MEFLIGELDEDGMAFGVQTDGSIVSVPGQRASTVGPDALVWFQLGAARVAFLPRHPRTWPVVGDTVAGVVALTHSDTAGPGHPALVLLATGKITPEQAAAVGVLGAQSFGLVVDRPVEATVGQNHFVAAARYLEDHERIGAPRRVVVERRPVQAASTSATWRILHDRQVLGVAVEGRMADMFWSEYRIIADECLGDYTAMRGLSARDLHSQCLKCGQVVALALGGFFSRENTEYLSARKYIGDAPGGRWERRWLRRRWIPGEGGHAFDGCGPSAIPSTF